MKEQPQRALRNTRARDATVAGDKPYTHANLITFARDSDLIPTPRLAAAGRTSRSKRKAITNSPNPPRPNLRGGGPRNGANGERKNRAPLQPTTGNRGNKRQKVGDKGDGSQKPREAKVGDRISGPVDAAHGAIEVQERPAKTQKQLVDERVEFLREYMQEKSCRKDHLPSISAVITEYEKHGEIVPRDRGGAAFSYWIGDNMVTERRALQHKGYSWMEPSIEQQRVGSTKLAIIRSGDTQGFTPEEADDSIFKHQGAARTTGSVGAGGMNYPAGHCAFTHWKIRLCVRYPTYHSVNKDGSERPANSGDDDGQMVRLAQGSVTCATVFDTGCQVSFLNGNVMNALDRDFTYQGPEGVGKVWGVFGPAERESFRYLEYAFLHWATKLAITPVRYGIFSFTEDYRTNPDHQDLENLTGMTTLGRDHWLIARGKPTYSGTYASPGDCSELYQSDSFYKIGDHWVEYKMRD